MYFAIILLAMKTNTKNNIKLFFKSWINNAACVEGGRHKPWYAAALILFFSLVVALVPTFVKAITTQGDSAVASNAYGIDVSSQRFVEALNEKGLPMEIKAKDDGTHYLDVNAADWNTVWTTKDEINNKYAVYQHQRGEGENKTIDLEVFYFNDVTEDMLKEINYKVITKEDGSKENQNRTSSYYIFTKDLFYVYIVNPQTLKSVTSIPGDYDSFEIGYLFNSINGRLTTAQSLDKAVTPDYQKYCSDTWQNWRNAYILGYNKTRLNVTWQSSLITTGINVGLILFFGLMIFIITRGKNNPFRVYTWWESQKIVWWAALVPGLIGCGLGFAFANFAQVIFPLMLGVRVMWMSMRTLRPDNVPAK